MVDILKLTYERVPLRRRAPNQTNYEVVIVKQATKRLICAALCFAMLAGFFPLAAAETGYDRGFDGGMAGTGNIYAHGLDVGCYYYSYATSVSDALVDASNMISWMGDKVFEYPIYFDYEDQSQAGIDATTASKICLAFMNKLRDHGYLVGLYSMSSWLEKSWSPAPVSGTPTKAGRPSAQ